MTETAVRTVLTISCAGCKNKKKTGLPDYMGSPVCAEDEGFKPPIPKEGIPDFESSAFGHSANLP